MFCDKNGDGLITQAADQEASEVTQENHFYPFGLNMEGAWSNTPSITDNKYQYNGKELVSDFGLEWNDYGARNYDAATSRWNAVDPMAEKYNKWSPYNYTRGNPVNLIDVNGMYDANPTDSKNTSAFGQDGSTVGGGGGTTTSESSNGTEAVNNNGDTPCCGDNYVIEAAQQAAEAMDALSQTFEGSVKLDRAIGVSADAKIMGVGVGVEMNLGKVEGEVNLDGLKLTGKVLDVNANIETKGLKGSLSGSAYQAEININREGTNVSEKILEHTLTVEKKNVSINTDKKVELAGKIGPVKLTGSINLSQAKKAFVSGVNMLGTLIMGTAKKYIPIVLPQF